MEKIGNRENAEAVVKAYSDLEGLERGECLALNIPVKAQKQGDLFVSPCDLLIQYLGITKKEGFIQKAEGDSLRQIFAPDFVQVLERREGRYAHQERSIAILETFIEGGYRDKNSSIRFYQALEKLGVTLERVSRLDVVFEFGLHSPDKDVRLAAVKAADEIGPKKGETYRYLMALVDDEKDPAIRYHAIRSLGVIGLKLGNPLKKRGEDGKKYGVQLLEKLIPQLGKGDDETRRAVSQTVGRLGSEFFGRKVPRSLREQAVQALQRELRHSNKRVYMGALFALAKLGLWAEDAIDDVLRLEKHPDSEVRRYTAFALGQMASDSEKVLSALFRLLEDDDIQVRRVAANGISTICIKLGYKKGNQLLARKIASSLSKTKDGYIIEKLLGALMSLESDAVEARDIVLEHARSKSERLQQLSYKTLGEMGSLAGEEGAKILLQAFEEKMSAGDYDNAVEIAKSLLEIIPKDVRMRKVVQQVIAINDINRISFLGALAEKNIEFDLAISELIKELDSDDLDRKHMALITLGGLGDKAKPFLPKLESMRQKEKEPSLLKAIEGTIRMIHRGF